MKKNVLSLLILASPLAYATTDVKDPLDYAVSVARDFSLGDSNQEGEYSCQYEIEEELEVGGNVRIVSCEGTREILVYGGQMVQSRFECGFTFEPMPLGSELWQVTFERCH